MAGESGVLLVGVKSKPSTPNVFPCFAKLFRARDRIPQRFLYHGFSKSSCLYPGVSVEIWEFLAGALGLRYEWLGLRKSQQFYPAVESGAIDVSVNLKRPTDVYGLYPNITTSHLLVPKTRTFLLKKPAFGFADAFRALFQPFSRTCWFMIAAFCCVSCILLVTRFRSRTLPVWMTASLLTAQVEEVSQLIHLDLLSSKAILLLTSLLGFGAFHTFYRAEVRSASLVGDSYQDAMSAEELRQFVSLYGYHLLTTGSPGRYRAELTRRKDKPSWVELGEEFGRRPETTIDSVQEAVEHLLSSQDNLIMASSALKANYFSQLHPRLRTLTVKELDNSMAGLLLPRSGKTKSLLARLDMAILLLRDQIEEIVLRYGKRGESAAAFSSQVTTLIHLSGFLPFAIGGVVLALLTITSEVRGACWHRGHLSFSSA